MSRNDLLPALNFTTLVVVLIAMAIVFALFMRKRSNRHPMDGVPERNVARDLDEGRDP